MSRPPKTIRQRAAAYASGKRTSGTHSSRDEGPLEEGWEAGYRAALRDVKRTAITVSYDVERELSTAFTEVVEKAAARFDEEMGKLL